jgi:ribosomal protein S18 acetylase RimI-like enzyme
MTDVDIRLASSADLDRLVTLYQQAQRWLASKGSDQWSANAEDSVRARFLQSIARGECFVACKGDGNVVGTITVDEFADPEFWTDRDQPESALYTHRMVVDRNASGQNIGGMLLDRAEEMAVKCGKEWLRLDAWRTNIPLHKYYSSQGFDLIRVVCLEHRGSGALFQRRAQRMNRS